MKAKKYFILFLLSIFFGVPLFSQNEDATEELSEAQQRLKTAQELYYAGEYEKCKELLDKSIKDAQDGSVDFPYYILARIYGLKALVSYAFREQGFQDEVEALLKSAIETDLNFEYDDPTIVPPYIIEAYTRIKKEYLDQYKKTTRRHCLGIYGALILQPSVLRDPTAIQPGIHYSFNISDNLTLYLNISIPLTIPIWNSLKARTGIIWFPTFKIESPSLGLSAVYSFGLERLESQTHSIIIQGYGEIIFRSAFGLAVSVELLRLDLAVSGARTELPEYGYLDLDPQSSLRFAFANMSFYLFLTF